MTYYYTYVITNVETAEFYVGVRKSQRHKPEDDPYMGSGTRLRASMRKHGRDRFYKRVLRTFNTYEAAAAEEAAHVNAFYLSLPGCLNIALGGATAHERFRDLWADPAWCKAHSDTQRRAQSRPEVIAKKQAAFEQRRDRVSVEHKQRWEDPVFRAKATAAMKGRPKSEAAKAKYKAVWTPERRAAQAERMRARWNK